MKEPDLFLKINSISSLHADLFFILEKINQRPFLSFVQAEDFLP